MASSSIHFREAPISGHVFRKKRKSGDRWIVVALLLVISHHVRKPAATVNSVDPDVETTQLIKVAAP